MGKLNDVRQEEVDCSISRTRMDICTIPQGSFENTLAFNSLYIHYSTLRCRYIQIYRYTVLVSCTNIKWDTEQASLTDWLEKYFRSNIFWVRRGSIEVALCLTVYYCEVIKPVAFSEAQKCCMLEIHRSTMADLICRCHIAQ